MADQLPHYPPPWTLKADVYLFAYYTTASQAANLPPSTYSPLEHASDYANPSVSKPVGGLSMLQIIRYTESPVGPYDELVVVPGYFEYEREDEQGRRKKLKGLKIGRIYVSQKETCYNGRLNWNIPKHLARFDWATAPSGAITVSVHPHDTHPDPAVAAVESTPSPTPFFRTTFKPTPYLPSFPFTTRVISSLGFDVTLVLPPLPKGSADELAATETWKSVLPHQYARNCKLGWFDIRQGERGEGGEENFLPGLSRWQLGMVMKGAEVKFDKPEDEWEPPRTSL
ncbi:Fc.00g078450.m01.CDS01 [Cosmosporella sp. VM-42]